MSGGHGDPQHRRHEEDGAVGQQFAESSPQNNFGQYDQAGIADPEDNPEKGTRRAHIFHEEEGIEDVSLARNL